MIIDCPYCKSRVDAEVHGSRKHFDPKEDALPYILAVLSCPSCARTLVGLDEELPNDDSVSVAMRIWPEPKRLVSWSVPDIVRNSLEEADRCFQAGAFTACAVMAGRALEGICVHHKAKATLATGLKYLRDQEIIDKRIFEWGEELRKVRNLGAHASTEKVSMENAQDVLDFAHVITEYVFVLNDKFDRFTKRRTNRDT